MYTTTKDSCNVHLGSSLRHKLLPAIRHRWKCDYAQLDAEANQLQAGIQINDPVVKMAA